MNASVLRKYRKVLNRFSGILSRNPVLYRGFALAPAVVACYNLKNAAAMSVAMAIILIPTLVAVAFIRNRIPFQLRMAIYPIISFLFYIPAHFTVTTLFSQITDQLGIYLPILVVDTLLISRAEQFAISHKARWVLLDSVCNALGFALVACVVGMVRELLGAGTIWGVSVLQGLHAPALLLPALGFILIGFLSALLQFGTRIYRAAVSRYLRHHASLALPEEPVPVVSDSTGEEGAQ